MPWSVEKPDKKGGLVKIKRSDTGEVVGHSTSREKALASVRARYANTHDVQKADYFGAQGLKNARNRLNEADKAADTLKTPDAFNWAKKAAKTRNKALVHRGLRLAPLALIPAAVGAYGANKVNQKRNAPMQTYNSGATVTGTGQ